MVLIGQSVFSIVGHGLVDWQGMGWNWWDCSDTVPATEDMKFAISAPVLRAVPVDDSPVVAVGRIFSYTVEGPLTSCQT